MVGGQVPLGGFCLFWTAVVVIVHFCRDSRLLRVRACMHVCVCV